MTRGFLKELLRKNKTVYTFDELCILWPNADKKTIKSRINYYIKQGDLHHIRKGLYAKDKNYDSFEVATQIYIPSYISFETVLRSAGIIFQYYSQIFVASRTSKIINCDGQEYIFRKIKSEIRVNDSGILSKDNYSIATAERAFLDMLYIHKDYYFDNLRPLNWEMIYEILPIYKNKRMNKLVEQLHKQAMKEKE